MVYVALSHSTTFSGLRILNFDPQTIYSSDDITEGLQKMQEFLPHNHLKISEKHLKFSFTEGLLPHRTDLQSLKKFTEAGIICFTETWLTKTCILPLKLFQVHDCFIKSRKESYVPKRPFSKPCHMLN